MCFENVPCKVFYNGENGVWNGSQTMWNSFQTSASIVENLHFLCFWNPSCVHRNVLTYACFCLRMQAIAHICGLRATLVILFPKIYFCSFKRLYFHFNTPQVNLISDWALNWPWALEFEHFWGTGDRVIRDTKCSVYKQHLTIDLVKKRGYPYCKNILE